ncbi:MAG TPA: ATP-dependent RNA helicase DbpA [Polyangiales bacterium]|nr:ATP-dependent RNA helicase DbpA [Polyangiales bacterium]
MTTCLTGLSLSPALLQVASELGFAKWTAIQAQAIPVLLSGRDLIGQSKTGSGKTAAFALAILERLRLDQRRTLQALVLCPTRELCAQVAREMRKLGRRQPGVQVLTLAGGEPLRAQASALERGVPIVVGTPGRVLDHLRRGRLQLEQLTTLVLDEADRMLEMGFQEDMEKILEATPAERQTVFFSATFPISIERMSARYQRQPVRVTVADEPAERANIRQAYVLCDQPKKLAALQSLLQRHPHDAALVFANQKVSVAEIAAALSEGGTSAAGIHGDLEQSERDLVLAKFRNGSTRALVASDVAARGIDIQSLDLVVNFDLPTRQDSYVHRIGRTGRAGRAGVAVSLVNARELPTLLAYAQALDVTLERLELTETPAEPSPRTAAAMQTLRVSGGRKQKVRPGDILGALTGEAAGLRGEQIGKIEIHDDFSYVAVEKRVARAAQRGLSEGRIKGKRFRVALVE